MKKLLEHTFLIYLIMFAQFFISFDLSEFHIEYLIINIFMFASSLSLAYIFLIFVNMCEYIDSVNRGKTNIKAIDVFNVIETKKESL